MTSESNVEVQTPTMLGRSALVSASSALHESIISPEGSILLVDKPYGETSFYVVNRIRKSISRSTGIKWVKVGHAGTLDPLATGLLLIATRGCTKQLASLTGLDKTYLVTVRFGVSSPSFDLERPIEIIGGEETLPPPTVQAAIEQLTGTHLQVPPAFSAVKQQGRPVYHLARKGEDVQLEPREIEVRSSEVVSVDLPFATFRVLCSKGTYVRSLVRDLGESLGTGAVLTELRRETVGEWSLDDALTLEEAVRVAAPME